MSSARRQRLLRMLSLCSGIGGIDYAWNQVLGQEIAGQVEIDDYCNAVLARHWPDVPRLRDIREVHGDEFGAVDVVAGGIPCQPWSAAGQQRGARDDRHLWPAMRRIVQNVRPRWVLVENVANFANLALDDVCTDLEFLFYEVTAFMVPAAAVAAPHLRERVFVVAHASEHGWRGYSQPRPNDGRDVQRQRTPRLDADRCDTPLADTRRERQQRGRVRGRPATVGTLQHDGAGNSGEGVAYSASRGPRCRPASWQGGQPAQCGEAMADDDSSRRDGLTLIEGQAPAKRGWPRKDGEDMANAARRGAHAAQQPRQLRGAVQSRDGQAQPRLGGATHGLSRWLDGHRWPAGPSEAQHEWEAPRTITGSVPNRAHRLKALGNAVVPAQVAPILAGIIEAHWQYAEVEA